MLETTQVLQNRYRLDRVLSQNAGKQTWQAIDLETQESVVVKLLTFSDQVQWDQLRLFEREAQTLKNLQHPRIPQYRDYFCMDDRLLWFALVQDALPGRSLKQALAENILFSEAEARRIAEQVLSILVYLHGLNPPVLHRDIKPSNLIQGEDGAIYLVDFGAVQDRAAKAGATFTVVGTYDYAPLEQFGGRAAPASDLYALGATLIHLLTGIAPIDLPQKEGRLQFAYLLTLNPSFARWLETMTAPNLRDRFATASEALAALRANEAAIVAAVASRPARSQISLSKSPQFLTIRIPRVPLHRALSISAIAGVTTALLSGRLISAGFGATAGLSVGGIVLLLLWLSQTHVRFDSQQFVIEWRLLGVLLRRQQGAISTIHRLFVSDRESFWQTKGGGEITIAVGVTEHTIARFDPPLTEEECTWLVSEIRSWLGLGDPSD